jgi:hypothetical protein
MSSFVKNSLIIFGFLVVGGYGYYLFFLDTDVSATLSLTGGASEARSASEQFIRELKEIQTFNLSKDVFKNEVFRSFVDFTEPKIEYPVGRTNPFASIE